MLKPLILAVKIVSYVVWSYELWVRAAWQTSDPLQVTVSSLWLMEEGQRNENSLTEEAANGRKFCHGIEECVTGERFCLGY